MNEFVLDSSASLIWAFADEATPAGDALLNDLRGGLRAWVPALWHLEVSNALLGALRRGRARRADVDSFMAAMRAVDIVVDEQTHGLAWDRTFGLAESHGLTTYDAAYLELALRLGLPVATLDHALRAACAKAGVKVLLG